MRHKMAWVVVVGITAAALLGGAVAASGADRVREREQLKDGSCETVPAAEKVQTREREQAKVAGEQAAPERTREREQLKDGSCETAADNR